MGYQMLFSLLPAFLIAFTSGRMFFCQATIIDPEGCQSLNRVKKTKDVDFIVIGLFPIHGHTKTEAFRYNPNGLIWSEATKYFIDMINQDKNLLKGVRLGYVVYDTCSEVGLALPAVLEVLLNDLVKTTNSTIKPDTCVCNGKSSVPFIGFVGDAASSISMSVSPLLSVDLIPQISYASTSKVLSDKDIYPSFLRTIPSDNFQVELIVTLVRHFNWSYISVIASDDSYGRLGLQQLVPALSKVDVCLAVERTFVDTSSIKTIVSQLKEATDSRVIVLWAQKYEALKFLEHAEKQELFHKIWIGTESWGHHNSLLTLHPYILSGLIGIAPYSGNFSLFRSHFGRITEDTYTDNSPWIRHYFELRKSYKDYKQTKNFGDIIDEFSFSNVGFISDAVYALSHALQRYIDRVNLTLPKFKSEFKSYEFLEFVKNVTFKGELDNIVEFNSNGDVKSALYYLKKVERLNGTVFLKTYGSWSSNHAAEIQLFPGTWYWPGNLTTPPLSKCSDPCMPGWYDFEGGTKCCWECIPCPDGYYKNHIGKNNCTKCPVLTVPDVNRAKCLPLVPSYPKANSPLALLAETLSLFGVVLIIFIIIVFRSKRKTPIIRSANIRMTFVQFMCQLLLFSSVFLYFGKPNVSLCIVRSALPGFLLTAVVTITLVKTEYLLRIFMRKTLLSSKFVTLSKTIEAVAVITLCIFHIFYTVILNIYLPHKLTIEISREELEIAYKCANDTFHCCAQLILVLVLTTACLVQAFRAKSLPHNYNEAKRITYCMLSLALTLALSLIFYVSLPNEKQKSSAVSLFLVLANYLVIFWLHGHRVLVVLCFKEQNTKKNFQSELFSYVQTRVAPSPSLAILSGRKCSELTPEVMKSSEKSNDSPRKASGFSISRSRASTICSFKVEEAILEDVENKT